MGAKLYLQQNVLEAVRERLKWVFDTHRMVNVSVSGGKDSCVLFDLAYREAQRRGRPINVFFLDQEAEYQGSIDVVTNMMYRDGVIPHWYQIPCMMTNAASYEQDMLYAWHPEYQSVWMRPQVDISIKDAIPAIDRFYKIVEWVDNHWGDQSCNLVGLRSDESLNRFRTVTRQPSGPNWATRISTGTIKAYPLYDWRVEDIWKYIGETNIKYNCIYDLMWMKGYKLTEMRVSNLIHEKAFDSLVDLQEFEPETYDRLLVRLKGIHTAARYAKEPMIFGAKKMPGVFQTWRAYRDFLIQTFPGDKLNRFLKRFSNQPDNERVYRQQVRQLLINDWENNVPVIQNRNNRQSLKKWISSL